MSCADNRANAVVSAVANRLHSCISPLLYPISYVHIKGLAAAVNVLKVGGGGVGGLNKREDGLVVLYASIGKGLDAVGTEIGVNGNAVGSSGIFAEECFSISFRGSADIAALNVKNYVHTCFFCIFDGLVKCFETFKSAHFVESRLRLYCRNNVSCAVDKSLVELIKSFTETSAASDKFGHVFRAGVKSHYCGVVLFFNKFR